MLCKHHSLKRICKNSKSKKAYCSLFSYISVILNKYLIKTGRKTCLKIIEKREILNKIQLLKSKLIGFSYKFYPVT